MRCASLPAPACDHWQATANMKSEFMSLWDGLITDEKSMVVIVGATNRHALASAPLNSDLCRPWDVDRAILRRMPRSFLVDIPTRDQRVHILDTVRGSSMWC